MNSYSKTVDLLKDHCSNLGGEVQFGFTCPKSRLPLPISMCHFKNAYNEDQFFDGCTGPTGGFSGLFYPACIKHDLCYHHEPATNGFDQKKCDDLFYEDMKTSCENHKDKTRCLKWSSFLYQGVRSIGKLAFHCENTPGHY